jgi:3'-5' exoribonuclease
LKNQWVKELEPGQKVDDIFVVRKLEVKEFNSRKYLSLEFGDKTGRIAGVFWEGFQDAINSGKITKGNIVKVQGMVATYRDMPQITVAALQPVPSASQDPTDFLPTGPREPLKLMAEIDAVIAKVEDTHYKNLLTEIFNDGIIRRKFTYAPAAKLWHHSYIGGLADHTLSVTKICLAACTIYDNLDRDLITAGGLLHDIGKIETYSLDNFFDYTDEGRLIGHIVIADRLIFSKLARLSDFPAEKKKLIRHLVLSHQGTFEQGSPVLPQTLEANILYVADLMDSRVGGILKVLGKKRLPEQRWTDYVKLIDRYIYLGESSGEDIDE